MNRKILAVLLVFFLGTGAYGATNTAPSTNSRPIAPDRLVPFRLLDQYRYRYRNPFLSGLLSSGMWGAGQIYCGEYKKGSLLVFGDLVYKGLLIGLILKFNNKYSSGPDESVRWSAFSAADKGLVIGYIATWLGISLLSISDAVAAAHRFNRANDLKNQLSLGFSAEQGQPRLLLGWKLPF